jgi:hypothetical protein
MRKTIINVTPASHGCFVITDRIIELDPGAKIRLIREMPRGQKPFKIAESTFCYTVTDDLYSLLCIRKGAARDS